MSSLSIIHYFNPGHETAVLNASKHYHPPAHVAKMQADLAFLPAWYASEGDFVLTGASLPDDFILSVEPLQLSVNQSTPSDMASNREMFRHSVVDLWGISPQSIHFFEKLSEQWNLSLAIPQWKEELRFLGSRFASQKIVAELLNCIPAMEKEILPVFVSDIEAIENRIAQSREKHLLKSPYSSSGRGLVWLPPAGTPAQSERQIIGGMLKKQGQVSIEKVLEKRIDFSMQFAVETQGETRFVGYSIFQTDAKGAYEKSRLARQEWMERQLTRLIDADVLLQTQQALIETLQEMVAPHYKGIIGIDMMVYRSGDSFRLHPCVEMNMRKNMGYLAIRLAEKYLHPRSQGEFCIEYNRNPQMIATKHRQMQMQHPLVIEDKRIRSGYLSLCPVTGATNYQAYAVVTNL